jgi:hypothetical protein
MSEHREEDELRDRVGTVIGTIVAQNWADALHLAFKFLEDEEMGLDTMQKSIFCRVILLQFGECMDEIFESIVLERDARKIMGSVDINDLFSI